MRIKMKVNDEILKSVGLRILDESQLKNRREIGPSKIEWPTDERSKIKNYIKRLD